MNLSDTLKTLNSSLTEVFQDKIDDPEVAAENIKALLKAYAELCKTTEDRFYLKKMAIWLIEITAARSREGHRITEYPAITAQLYDKAYYALCDTSIKEGGHKIAVDSLDKDFSSAIEVPKFDPQALLVEALEGLEEEGDQKDQGGPSRLTVVEG